MSILIQPAAKIPRRQVADTMNFVFGLMAEFLKREWFNLLEIRILLQK